MNQRDRQSESNLRVSGYGTRIRQTLIAVVVIGVIVAAIVFAAIWANSREPETGVQPTPRPTQPPEPTATLEPPTRPTYTPVPTEIVETQNADTPTPEPTASTVEEASTKETVEPTIEPSKADTASPSDAVTESIATATPRLDIAPTPEPTAEPVSEPTETPVPATEVPPTQPAPTATQTPKPTPTVVPTNTPIPLPTATFTPTATPTPEVPTKLEIYARGDLIDKGIDQSGIKVLSVVEHTWPDLTLGCGPIKDDNPARAVMGWILILGNDETSFTFHIASQNQGDEPSLSEDIIINCTDAGDVQQTTVNLVHDLRLHEARRIVLYRGSVDQEQKPIEDIQDPGLVQTIIDTLNVNIPIGNTEICETAFRLDFYVLQGIESVHFFCEKDWYRVGGDQDVWRGTQGAIPSTLLDVVAPYFASAPLPPIPTFIPE